MFKLQMRLQTISTYQNRTPARVVSHEDVQSEHPRLADALQKMQSLAPIMLSADIYDSEKDVFVLCYSRDGGKVEKAGEYTPVPHQCVRRVKP